MAYEYCQVGNKVSISKIEEELTCAICCETLSHPKILTQCSHSFCCKCLEQLNSQAKSQKDRRNNLNSTRLVSSLLECPTCRKVTIIPEGKIECLPTNYALQNMAEIVADMPEVEVELQLVCAEHNTVLNQYCVACNELLCSECIHSPKHREHLQRGDIRLTRDILPEHLENLSSLIQPATDVALQAVHLQEEIEKRKAAISSNATDTKGKIDSYFQKLAEQVETRRQLLLSSVDEHLKEKLTTLDDQGSKLHHLHQSSISVVSKVKALRQLQDTHALTKGELIETDLQKSEQSLATLKAQLQSQWPGKVLRFQEDKKYSDIKSFGSLALCELKHGMEYETFGAKDEIDFVYEIARDDLKPRSIIGPVLERSPMPLPQQKISTTMESVSRQQSEEVPSPVSPPPCRVPLPQQIFQRSLEDSWTQRFAAFNFPESPQQSPRPPSRKSFESSMNMELTVAEVILPVQVINNDQLSDSNGHDRVFPTGICVSSLGNITITDPHNHCLRQLSKTGNFVQTFGPKGACKWELRTPVALAMSEDHAYMYVASQVNAEVLKFSVNGKYIQTMGKKKLQSPAGIAISQIHGDIYISDSVKKCVYIYQRDGTYSRPIGKYEKDIQFQQPQGVAFDTAGNLLVVDRGATPCVWHISQPETELLGRIGLGYLRSPSDVGVTEDGCIVVTEKGKANRVSIFTNYGLYICCFGKTGCKPGEFNGPSGIAINGQGQIIVADQHNQRVQIFEVDICQS